MTDVTKVISQDGRRVFFEGDEDSAREYVERNFPRVHAEPNGNYGEDGPPADVYVQAPNGDKAEYRGGKWPEPAPVESAPVIDLEKKGE